MPNNGRWNTSESKNALDIYKYRFANWSPFETRAHNLNYFQLPGNRNGIIIIAHCVSVAVASANMFSEKYWLLFVFSARRVYSLCTDYFIAAIWLSANRLQFHFVLVAVAIILLIFFSLLFSALQNQLLFHTQIRILIVSIKMTL